ncbi:MAG: NHLP leader peptide family RiPP precursor [Rhodospirillaceae bacterium]
MTTAPSPPAQPASRRDLEARIIAKAWRDPAYKARLLSDPKSVLQEELKAIDPSIELPNSLQIKVQEEKADRFHLVLPVAPQGVSTEPVAPGETPPPTPSAMAAVLVSNAAAQLVGTSILQAVVQTGPTSNSTLISGC